MQIATEMAALRRLARALTTDPDAADDLVQDTLLAAIRHPPDEATPVRPWLATVLRRRQLSVLRSAHRESARLAAMPDAESSPSPETLQVIRQLAEELASLPGEDQRVLELRFGDGCSAAECADVLGRPASTVRTQIQRALLRLRSQLDRRAGGRAAWMPALVAIGFPGTRTAAAPVVLGPKALSLGAVLAATVLWLGAATPNGCGSTFDGASADPSPQSRGGPTSSASLGPTAANDADAPAPMRLPVVDPDDDDDVTKWGAAPSQENAAKQVHPLLAVSMALRGVHERTGRCHTSGGVGSARMALKIRFDPDGSTSFERVDFSRVKGLDADELECIRQTVSARELQVRAVDVTMLGFPHETTVEYGVTSDLTMDADGEVEVQHVEEQPRVSIVRSREYPALVAALAECGAGPVAIDVTFDPKTRLPTKVAAAGEHAEDAQGRCASAAVAKVIGPAEPYEPRGPADSLMHCTFGVQSDYGPYECKSAGPRGSDDPRPVE